MNTINDERLQVIMNEARMGPNSRYESQENNLIGLLDFVKHHNLSDKTILEIGCYLGISTELFAMYSKHVTTIDLWGIDENYDGGECPKEYWPYIEKSARERLSKYKNVSVIKDFAKNVHNKIGDESLDLIYLDGNHSYDNVKNEIEQWYNKLKIGGYMTGHDYVNETKKAIDEMYIIKEMESFVTFKDYSWSMKKVK